MYMATSDALFKLCRDDPDGAVELVEMLKGSSPEELDSLVGFRDEKDATPLFIASENGHCRVIELLLANGADKEAANHEGRRPIYMASRNGHLQVVELLLSAGADKNAKNNNGGTPLYTASYFGHHQVVEMLVGWC